MKISTPYYDPVSPKTYKQNDPWISAGAFVAGVQHAFDNLQDADLLYEELDGFYGAAQSAFSTLPSSGSEPFQIHFGDGQETASWTTFKSALYNAASRNLIYFGHGGPTGIGYYSSNPSQYISDTEIQSMLHTIPAGQTNRHVFRFVFLDGCQTAKGDLPQSFGIINQQNVPSINYYYSAMRPSCFCGWSASKSVGFSIGNVINYDHVNFFTYIQDDMLLNGDTIQGAIAYAKSHATGFITTSDFLLLGCPDVTFGSQNN